VCNERDSNVSGVALSEVARNGGTVIIGLLRNVQEELVSYWDLCGRHCKGVTVG
jgi:hypothetical protein